MTWVVQTRGHLHGGLSACQAQQAQAWATDRRPMLLVNSWISNAHGHGALTWCRTPRR